MKHFFEWRSTVANLHDQEGRQESLIIRIINGCIIFLIPTTSGWRNTVELRTRLCCSPFIAGILAAANRAEILAAFKAANREVFASNGAGEITKQYALVELEKRTK